MHPPPPKKNYLRALGLDAPSARSARAQAHASDTLRRLVGEPAARHEGKVGRRETAGLQHVDEVVASVETEDECLVGTPSPGAPRGGQRELHRRHARHLPSGTNAPRYVHSPEISHRAAQDAPPLAVSPRGREGAPAEQARRGAAGLALEAATTALQRSKNMWRGGRLETLNNLGPSSTGEAKMHDCRRVIPYAKEEYPYSMVLSTRTPNNTKIQQQQTETHTYIQSTNKEVLLQEQERATAV